MLNPNFVIVGTLIGSIGGLSYLVYTLQGKVKPNRVTYLLWGLASSIAFAAQINQGVGIQSLMTFAAGFVPLLIFISSFFNKKSEWKITKFDLICGGLSLAGLTLWLITQVGNLAILFSVMADGLAALPTIIKSYKYPETESGWTYFTGAISGLLTLSTITNWSFAYYAFPLYILLANFIIAVLVQFKIGQRVAKLV